MVSFVYLFLFSLKSYLIIKGLYKFRSEDMLKDIVCDSLLNKW